MSDPSELAGWTRSHVAGFREVERALSLTTGFALMPVEVSGPDVAHALARWLEERGRAPALLEPLDDEAWGALVARLLEMAPVEGRVVVVIGARQATPAVYAALRLLNQRRDSAARQLGCSLLWCGPPEFLRLTWERAPDFWSVRALTLKVAATEPRPNEPPLWPGAWVTDPPERLREMTAAAEKHGDERNAARLGALLVEVLLAQGELDEAQEALALAQARATTAGDQVRTELALAQGTLAALRGEPSAARAAFESIDMASGGGAALEGRRLLCEGNLLLSSDAEAAVARFEEARARLAAAADRANEGVAVANLGVAALRAGAFDEGAARFEEALELVVGAGDERGEARVLAKLGAVHLARRDSRRAAECFEEALAIFRDVGDRRGEAESLRRLARAYLNIGDPEKAREDARRALGIERIPRDEDARAEARALLAQAEAELADDDA